MKRIISGLGLFILCMRLCAQQEYFVFIEQGSGMPFYARIGEKNYSSSSTGHLVIPSLTDSVYSVYIGFPRNRYPEQLFSVAINRKDRGFNLDNKDGKGWMLTDLQSQQVLKPATALGVTVSEGSKKTDSYSQLMAGVVDDSAVLYASSAREELPLKKQALINDTPREQEKKPVAGLIANTGAPIQANKEAKNEVVAAKDSSRKEPRAMVVIKQDTAKNKTVLVAADSVKAQKQVAVLPAPVIKNTTATVVSKDSAVEKDSANNNHKMVKGAIARKDTVLPASVPKADIVVDGPVKKDTPVVSGAKPDTPQRKEETTSFTIIRDSLGRPVGVNQPVMVKPRIVNISSAPVTDGKELVYIDQGAGSSDTITIIIPAGEAPGSPDTLKPGSQPKVSSAYSQCRDIASETDLDKLRVKLLAEKTEENKLVVARNAFTAKCFTTRQVRALSELFTGDPGRYQLLDTAYPFISDPGNFGAMADLLKEDYYINRFKTLVSR